MLYPAELRLRLGLILKSILFEPYMSTDFSDKYQYFILLSLFFLGYIETMHKEIRARVFKSGKRQFECKLENDSQTIQATALREVFKENHPVVGDLVRLEINQSGDDDLYEIHEVFPRENEVYRRIVRENKKKVIASNVDVLMIVTSVSNPPYKPYFIDRYLLRAIEWEIPAIVIFNKMDEFDHQFNQDFERERFTKLGAKSFFISSKFPETTPDFKELQELLKNRISITLGQSGVGKSKLISCLSDGKIQLASGALAKGVNKGAHTTTWAELVDCGDFQIVDSPGIRSLSVQDFNQEELHLYFPDLIPIMEKCKFNDCRHEHNSKGCAFLNLDPEVFEERILLDRLESYQRIRSEVESIPEWKKSK
jgi:ribosome biogenesis GTPase